MDCEIRVHGELDADWSDWFEGLTVTVHRRGGQPSVTTLSGPVADQSALRGILNQLWDLNMTLMLVRCYDSDRGGL